MLATGIPEVLGTDPALGQRACWTACSPSPPSGRHLLSPLALSCCVTFAGLSLQPPRSRQLRRLPSLACGPPACEIIPRPRSRSPVGGADKGSVWASSSSEGGSAGLGLGLGRDRWPAFGPHGLQDEELGEGRRAHRLPPGSARACVSTELLRTRVNPSVGATGREHSSPPRLLPVQPDHPSPAPPSRQPVCRV